MLLFFYICNLNTSFYNKKKEKNSIDNNVDWKNDIEKMFRDFCSCNNETKIICEQVSELCDDIANSNSKEFSEYYTFNNEEKYLNTKTNQLTFNEPQQQMCNTKYNLELNHENCNDFEINQHDNINFNDHQSSIIIIEHNVFKTQTINYPIEYLFPLDYDKEIKSKINRIKNLKILNNVVNLYKTKQEICM